MLSALSEEGELLNLIYGLPAVMPAGKFYCPACKERVILKAGPIRIPHFAHQKNSDCVTSVSEPESQLHLSGKRHLHQYFISLDYDVKMEYYIKKLKQRPDLLIHKEGIWKAIEFQCYPISQKLLEKRTKGYSELGIVPVWIIGGLPYLKQKRDYYELSDFHYSLSTNVKSRTSIMSYDPKTGLAHTLSQITPFTTKRAFATLNSTPLNSENNMLTSYSKRSSATIDRWLLEKRSWIERRIRFGNLYKDPFLSTIYQSGHHPSLLPIELGIPVASMEMFKSHPLEWQFFIWIDVLEKLVPGNEFSVRYVEQKIRRRVQKRELSVRHFPLHPELEWTLPIESFFQQLARLGYMEARENIWILNKKLDVPNHIEDARKDEGRFCHRYESLFEDENIFSDSRSFSANIE